MSARRFALPLACLLAIALLAWQVLTGGPVVRLDAQLTEFFAARRQGWLTAFMLAVANGHDTVVVLGATALVALWRVAARQLQDLVMLAVIPPAMLLNVGLKNVFQRPRPVLEEPLVHLGTFSFPSGHAVAATVFYGALCILVFLHARSAAVRVPAAAFAITMVLLVAFSRIYLGAHYLSDVVAGVCVGVLCLLPFRRLLLREAGAAHP